MKFGRAMLHGSEKKWSKMYKTTSEMPIPHSLGNSHWTPSYIEHKCILCKGTAEMKLKRDKIEIDRINKLIIKVLKL